ATATVITVLYSIFFLGCTLLIVPGIWYMIKKEQYHELILLAGVCAYLWIIPVGNLDWRFRMPAEPLLFIFICSGIVYLNEKYIEKQPKKEKVQ
ncbi:MAG: hypothetical protein JXR78_14875, partial [Victivallales bacterium]|nr:hypothetical protein [Victivallales bacterium]